MYGTEVVKFKAAGELHIPLYKITSMQLANDGLTPVLIHRLIQSRAILSPRDVGSVYFLFTQLSSTRFHLSSERRVGRKLNSN